MDGCRGGSVIQLPFKAAIDKPQITVQGNDKYGKWTDRAKRVCEGWDESAKIALKAMGFPCKMDTSSYRGVDVGNRSFAASFPPTPLYRDFTLPPAGKHGNDIAKVTFQDYNNV